MMNNDAIEYAERLTTKYGVKFDKNLLTGTEVTTYDVAKAVLPIPQLKQWLNDQIKEMELLREKLDLKPYDLHTKETKAELEKY